jgi:glycosyltransferase involved in cell wall biosynthesis
VNILEGAYSLPLVSVAICCYNSERYLDQTIQSVIKQTIKDWELIIVNDGSRDSTEDIIKYYINNGYNIIYHSQENKGFGAARNKCVELANSDYIAIIDHDDICLPNRLEVQINSAKKYPHAALFFSNSEHFLDDGTIIKKQFDSFDIDPCTLKLSSGSAAENLLFYGCFIDSETVLFRKDAAIKVGGFNSVYKYIVDYDFFLRIGEKYDIICDSQVLAQWRVHPRQASRTMRETIYLETMDLLKKWVCKPTIPVEIQTAIQLQSWLCLIRYSVFLIGLGRFHESSKCILESFNKNLHLNIIVEYLIKKIYRHFVRKYLKQ